MTNVKKMNICMLDENNKGRKKKGKAIKLV